jgi:hypothetical protein
MFPSPAHQALTRCLRLNGTSAGIRLKAWCGENPSVTGNRPVSLKFQF